METRRCDAGHEHPSWRASVRAEYVRHGELHRHRIVDPNGAVRYTTWKHNTAAHTHRLPDGVWTAARRDLTTTTPVASSL